MLKKYNLKKINKAILFSVMLIVMLTIAFCFSNITFAEENNNFDVHIKGDFKDGDRYYGAYHTSFYVNKINSTEYRVNLDITLTTQDWKSDKYFYQTFGYYFFGSNVKIKSASDRRNSMSIKTEYGKFDNSLVEMNEKGIGGCVIDFKKANLAKQNNYPVIREEFIIQVIGSYPSLGFAFCTMDLMGVFLAKDTRISNEDFVRFEMNSLNFSDVGVIYKYKPNYKNMTLIQNAAFTTLGGPVPDSWRPWGIL